MTEDEKRTLAELLDTSPAAVEKARKTDAARFAAGARERQRMAGEQRALAVLFLAALVFGLPILFVCSGVFECYVTGCLVLDPP